MNSQLKIVVKKKYWKKVFIKETLLYSKSIKSKKYHKLNNKILLQLDNIKKLSTKKDNTKLPSLKYSKKKFLRLRLNKQTELKLKQTYN